MSRLSTAVTSHVSSLELALCITSVLVCNEVEDLDFAHGVHVVDRDVVDAKAGRNSFAVLDISCRWPRGAISLLAVLGLCNTANVEVRKVVLLQVLHAMFPVHVIAVKQSCVETCLQTAKWETILFIVVSSCHQKYGQHAQRQIIVVNSSGGELSGVCHEVGAQLGDVLTRVSGWQPSLDAMFDVLIALH